MRPAVIFDLDGTLLDTLDDLSDSVNFILSKHGLPLRTREEVRGFVGNGVPLLIERALPHKKHPLYGVCLEEFKEYYKEHSAIKTAPYPGIAQALEEFVRRGASVGVVSNKLDIATKQLCRDYFGALVEVAVGDREGIEKKPAPDSVFEVMAALNCDRAFYVGDSDVDIQTAKNAGLPCVSVTWGFRDADFLKAHGATLLAETPDRMLDAVISLLGGL